MADIFKIFLELNGRQPRKIVSQTIEKGRANTGIYVHEIHQAADTDGQAATLRILEKRPTTKAEVRRTKLVKSWQNQDDKKFSVFPAIFRVVENTDESVIFMEYLDGVGPPPGFTENLADAVVSSIIGVNQKTADPPTTKPKSQKETSGILSGWEKLVRRATLGQGLDDTIGALVRDVTRALSKQPVVMSHNDLFWQNMAFDPQENTVRFLDLGHLDNSIAGAEFHHFYRHSIEREQERAFFGRMVSQYAARTQFGEGRLRIAYQYYALIRSCQRVNWLQKTRGEDAVAREKAVVEVIMSDLELSLSDLA